MRPSQYALLLGALATGRSINLDYVSGANWLRKRTNNWRRSGVGSRLNIIRRTR